MRVLFRLMVAQAPWNEVVVRGGGLGAMPFDQRDTQASKETICPRQNRQVSSVLKSPANRFE